MEGRKLQITGGSTYIVSLPKRWVVAAGLKAGDTVFVDTEADGSVSVRPRPAGKPEPRRKVFEEKPGGEGEHLLRKLIGAYISGYGLIEIRLKPDDAPLVRRVARRFCRAVIGPEIIEETRNALVLQDLSDPAELSSEKCLRRMYMTVRAMLEDALVALRTGDEALARDVVQRDQDVDRLYWVVAKQYHLAHAAPLGDGRVDTWAGIHNHRLIAKLLERIGDHAERMAGVFPAIAPRGLHPKLAGELSAANEAAVAILDQAFRALLTEDLDLANGTIDARVPHAKRVEALYRRVSRRKGEELLALATIVDSIGRAAGYATDIAEIAINSAMHGNGEKP